MELRRVLYRSRAAHELEPDQHLQTYLVDRGETRKGLVENDQVGRVDDRPDQLHHLRHALRHLADFFVDHPLQPQFGHEDRGAAASLRPVQPAQRAHEGRSEEHTSELQSLMRISYAVFCLKKKNKNTIPLPTLYCTIIN